MDSQLQTKQFLTLFCFCLCFVAIAKAMPAPKDPSQEEILAKVSETTFSSPPLLFGKTPAAGMTDQRLKYFGVLYIIEYTWGRV